MSVPSYETYSEDIDEQIRVCNKLHSDDPQRAIYITCPVRANTMTPIAETDPIYHMVQLVTLEWDGESYTFKEISAM